MLCAFRCRCPRWAGPPRDGWKRLSKGRQRVFDKRSGPHGRASVRQLSQPVRLPVDRSIIDHHQRYPGFGKVCRTVRLCAAMACGS